MVKFGELSSKLALWGRVLLEKGNQAVFLTVRDPKVHSLVYSSSPLVPALPSTARSSKIFLASSSPPSPTPKILQTACLNNSIVSWNE